MNLVYVDDDSDDHLFLTEAIRQSACNSQVTSLFNGAQLIDFLFKTGKYKSSMEPKPDLILLDINMPVMNGITCLRTLKSIPDFKEIPVFILSTSKDLDSVNECVKLGASGYYTKPILAEDLEEVINDILMKVEGSGYVSSR